MKLVLVASIMFLLVAVSGCMNENTIEPDLFVGGSQSLDISFLTNNPPSQVPQNRNFNVILKMENMGEYPIPEDEIYLVLSNAQSFGILDSADYVVRNSVELFGRVNSEEDYIPGGIDYLEFNDLAYKGQAVLTEKSPVSIAVDACYPYKTMGVVQNLCISRGLDSVICNPIGTIPIQTSSGPVQITGVDQQMNGLFNSEVNDVLLQIKIDFEIVDDGDIYDADATCSDLDTALRDVVTIEEMQLGPEEYTQEEIASMCGFNGNKIDFVKGKGKVFCEIPIKDVVSDYTDRFYLSIAYKHTVILNKQIAIIPAIDVNEDIFFDEEDDVEAEDEVDNSISYADLTEENRGECEKGIIIKEYDFEGDTLYTQDYGLNQFYDNMLSSYCSETSGWEIISNGYQSAQGLYTTADLEDVQSCIATDNIVVPENSNLKLSFISNFNLDGEEKDNIHIICDTAYGFKRFLTYPGEIGIAGSTENSANWEPNDDGWAKFEAEVPAQCLTTNELKLIFSSKIDADLLTGPVSIDDIKIEVVSCNAE